MDRCYWTTSWQVLGLTAAALATIQTSETYGGRWLGVIKKVTVRTNVMVTFTGVSLNMSGEIATRNLLCYLDTGLERPQDRSSNGFKIPNL